ncbi:MAG: hypothetical protein K9G76_12715 [Bacteroidales bacterium]|nr:hypothetical protein [Bacteroidales bacterium]MCF8405633.1 hypothetical protein [Bacteroidales bacterium]
MELKEKILSKCKTHLLEMRKGLQLEMEEAQKSANEYGAPKDRYDSYRTQLLRKRDMFAQQIVKLDQQIEVLEKVKPGKISEKVEFGSVVITDKQKLFVSTGLGKIEVGGEQYFVISPQVPVYRAMEGLKKNESFVVNGIRSQILELH